MMKDVDSRLQFKAVAILILLLGLINALHYKFRGVVSKMTAIKAGKLISGVAKPSNATLWIA